MSYDQTARTRSRIQPRSAPIGLERRAGRDRPARPSPSRMMNASSETYSAPKTVAIQACEPVARIGLGERRDRDEDDPDGDEQEAAALEDLAGPPRRGRRRARARCRAPRTARSRRRVRSRKTSIAARAVMSATAAARTAPPRARTTSRTGTRTAALIARWRIVAWSVPVSARSGGGGWRTRGARRRTRPARSRARAPRTK